MSIKFSQISVSFVSCLVTVFFLSNQALSQTGADLEEIIVTATKREQRLQDVPMSVNVVSQESIEIQGIRSAQQLAIGVPGLDYQTLNRGANSSFIVRGIATTSDDQNQVNKTVSLYIDEIPLTSSNLAINPEIGLMDVSRVEVLKGPQGTLFGSGTLGGVVRVVTNQPDSSGFDSSLGLDVGITDGERSTLINGMVNIPLSANVAFRLAASIRDDGGYTRNTGTCCNYAGGTVRGSDPANGQNDHNLRASLGWDLNENLSAKLMIMSQETDNDDSSGVNPSLGDRLTKSSIMPDTQETEVNLLNLTINYTTDIADLVFSSSRSDVSSRLTNDLSSALPPVGFPFLQLRFDQEDNTVNELRAVSNGDGRFQWVLGYFDLERETEFQRFFHVTQAWVNANGPITGMVDVPGIVDNAYIYGAAEYDYVNLRTNVDRETAIFAEGSYDLSSRLTATIGLRFGEVEQDDISRAGGSSDVEGGFLVPVVFMGQKSFTPVPYDTDPFATGKQDADTMKFSLAWQVSDEANIYISASEGFRGPVYNAAAATNGGVSTADASDIVILPLAGADSLWMYEVGLKGVWNDGGLTANVALYQADWEDIQMTANRVSDRAQFTYNVDGAELNGLELDITNYFNDAFMMGLSLNLSSSEITDLTQQQVIYSGAEMGSRLVGPDQKLAAFAQYNVPMNGNEVVVRADLQHVGEMPNTFPNTVGSPDTPNGNYEVVSSYTNMNASIGYVTDDWSVAVYAENLFDNDDFTFVGPTSFQDFRYKTLRPRTFGIRVTLR